MTSLIVEDEVDLLDLFDSLLSGRGHTVTCCTDGITAWQSFQDRPCDLAIIDLKLPTTSGLDLCRKIRAHHAGEYCVIVIMTGQDEPDSLDAVLAAGADDYLRKPLDFEFLDIRLAIAERHIINSAQRRQAEEALRDSEARFRNLAESVRVVPWEAHVDNRQFSYVGPQAEEILGYSEARWREPGFWSSCIHHEDRVKAQDYCNDAAEKLDHFDLEYRMTSKSGRTVWLHDIVHVQRVNGDAKKLHGFLIDITEAKRAEEVLRVVAEGTAGVTGDNFFRSLVERLVSALDVRYAFVAECCNAGKQLRTLAFWTGDGIGENIEYDISLPLGETATAGDHLFYDDQIQQLFPQRAGRLNPDSISYIGVPIFESTTEVIGHLVVMDTKPMPDESRIRSIMNVFATRAGAEMERMRSENRITAALQEKEILLQEIFHRVKNNLQVISSLLNLQSRNIANSEAGEIIKDTRDRIYSMALIHEQLYRSKNLNKIDFKEYLGKLISHLLDSYGFKSKSIDLNIDVENLDLNLDHAVPCGLIIHELVSNSLQHAFSPPAITPGDPPGNHPKIDIHFHSTDDQYQMIVSDNGCGLGEEVAEGTFRSLGLRLVMTLTKAQLKGTLDIDRSSGTRFRILFKKHLTDNSTTPA